MDYFIEVSVAKSPKLIRLCNIDTISGLGGLARILFLRGESILVDTSYDNIRKQLMAFALVSIFDELKEGNNE